MKSLPVIGAGQRSYARQTQAYSTWGGKLLQHADRLAEIQNERRFRPITVQLAPTEACDLECGYCSVGNRDTSKRIPWASVERLLRDFRFLGAKSVEITGGGNPLLYRDSGKDINHVVWLAHSLGYKIGIITNSKRPLRNLRPDLVDLVDWIRVSLSYLDDGAGPEDFDFDGIPADKLGLSYIIHGDQYGKPGTTAQTIENIARVVERNPGVKFVRIAPDCLTDDSLTIKDRWGGVVEAMDRHGKMFMKEIGEDYHPFDGGCWVGMLRPYVTAAGGVMICSSHVLATRNYRPEYRLCGFDEVPETWARMNERFAAGLPPYEVDIAQCFHCYYKPVNQILHYTTTTLPDRDFA